LETDDRNRIEKKVEERKDKEKITVTIATSPPTTGATRGEQHCALY